MTYGTDSNTKSQTANILGQTTSATDNQGTINYTYDAVGNLLTTTGVDGAVMTMGYNNGRQKITMDDPDKGKWSYRYNAADELVLQRDPRGFNTYIYRDNTGRTVRKAVFNVYSNLIEENIATFTGHR